MYKNTNEIAILIVLIVVSLYIVFFMGFKTTATQSPSPAATQSPSTTATQSPCFTSAWFDKTTCSRLCGGGKKTQVRTSTCPDTLLTREASCNTQTCDCSVRWGPKLGAACSTGCGNIGTIEKIPIFTKQGMDHTYCPDVPVSQTVQCTDQLPCASYTALVENTFFLLKETDICKTNLETNTPIKDIANLRIIEIDSTISLKLYDRYNNEVYTIFEKRNLPFIFPDEYVMYVFENFITLYSSVEYQEVEVVLYAEIDETNLFGPYTYKIEEVWDSTVQKYKPYFRIYRSNGQMTREFPPALA